MPIAINGLDGNSWSIRDMVANTNNIVFTYHKLTFSGSYATGGDTLDLSGVAALIPSGVLPLSVQPLGQGSADCQTAEGGYYSVKQGTTLKNFLMQVWEPGGTELGAGAYDAEVIADVVLLIICWRKLSN